MSTHVPDRRTVLAERPAEHGADALFRGRWSPKAFTAEPLEEATMLRLFEAARWAPSALNEQPWRFVWLSAGQPEWGEAIERLDRGNQPWASRAGALIFVFAHRTHRRNGKPNRTWQFETGLAVMSILLQAEQDGLATHVIGGIDHEAVLAAWGPEGDDWEAICGIVVGRLATEAAIPEAERSPNSRRPLAETVRRIKGGGA